MFVRLGPSQLLEIRSGRSRITIVREDRSSAQHHTVFHSDTATNVDKCIDLYSITDDNAGSDVTFLSNDALLANSSGMADVHVVPDRCPFSDPNVTIDNR